MTTTTNAAQDEFNELFRDKDHETRHPEDRAHDSDASDPESDHAADYLETIDTDDELDLPPDMRANYYMPSLRSEANTGPKGVIADAQAFEQAKKAARRFTWKKSPSTTQYSGTSFREDKVSSDEEDEESFLRSWRETRLRELQSVGQRIRSRTNSPSRRIYGNMKLVDGEGYLDAVDKTAAGTVVVVFIFDDRPFDPEDPKNDGLQDPQLIEAYMHDVAKRNDTVRFIKLHNELADITDDCVPAVLAYKGGQKFADVMRLAGAFPKDSELSAVSLETVLRQHRVL